MHCSYAPQVKSRQHLDILNFACRSIRPISIKYAILGLYKSTIQRDQPHQSASADQHGRLSLHSAAALTAHHQLQLQFVWERPDVGVVLLAEVIVLGAQDRDAER